MFLTYELLERRGLPADSLNWFKDTYPDGAELSALINNATTTVEFLYWLHLNVTFDEVETNAYLARLEVKCTDPKVIFDSTKITDSAYITRSARVANSSYVTCGEDIKDSSIVLNSSNVYGSCQIFDSEFIYNSRKVIQSKNVSSSNNAVKSTFVVNSTGVVNAASVTDSNCIIGAFGPTRDITNCAFISDCINMKNSLFCANVSDKENYLFNQPASPSQIDLIRTQLTSVLGDWTPCLTDSGWSSATTPIDPPLICRSPARQLAHLPEVFWRWVETLPNYKPTVLYSITYQSALIQQWFEKQ